MAKKKTKRKSRKKKAAKRVLESCSECEGIGTVPAFKPDEHGNPTKEQYETHAHGSMWCPSCGGSGKGDFKEVE